MDNSGIRVFDLDFRRKVQASWDKDRPLVHHAVLEGRGISFKHLEYDQLVEHLEAFCEKLDLHVVNKLDHQFVPQGKSIVLVLEESHLAVHSWPERGYVHMDVVTCQKEELDSKRLTKEFEDIFHPENTRLMKFKY